MFWKLPSSHWHSNPTALCLTDLKILLCSALVELQVRKSTLSQVLATMDLWTLRLVLASERQSPHFLLSFLSVLVNQCF